MRRPAAATYRFWLMALAAVTVLRLVMAACLPLSPDEAYYWLWSQHLQAGYFDHPPMVAYFIAAGTLVAGKTTLGVRLLGPLAAALGSLLLWDAAEQFFPGRHAGLIAAGLFNATLIAGVGAIIMTPDTPLLLFWAATIAAIARWHASQDPRWWLAIGLAAGAALLSKYTALFLLLGTGLWLLTQPAGRAALRRLWPWAGLLAALIVFAPDIYWNALHGWVSYLKQGGRVAHFSPARSAQFLVELVVGQIGLATPLVCALAAAGLWWQWRAKTAIGHLLLWLSLPAALVFVEHVLSGRVQANWPAIIFIPGCLAAAALPQPALDRWLRPALALGLAFTFIVYAQALAAPIPLPARDDPAALQMAGWPDFIARLAAEHPAFLTSDDYTTLAELAWAPPPGIPIIAAGLRWQTLALPAAPVLGPGLSVSHNQDSVCHDPLGNRTRNRANDPVMNYHLCGIALPAHAVLLAPP